MSTDRARATKPSRPHDVNKRAFQIVQELTGETPQAEPKAAKPKTNGKAEPKPVEKNAAAVELGRKGGQARAKNMTPEQRQASAKKAIEARWAKTRD